MKNNYDIDAIRASLTIPQLLRQMGHDCEDGAKMIKSPFRDEKTASCSIFMDGRKWKDFGSEGHGDVIDMYCSLTGKSFKDAVEEVAKIAGIVPGRSDIDGTPLSSVPAVPTRWGRKRSESISIEYLRAQRVNLKHYLARPEPSSAKRSLSWIPEEHLLRILRKGWLGSDYRGNLTYLMRNGIKVRNDPGSSRGDRWIQGKAGDNMFVSFDDNDIQDPKRDQLLLCEGESDTIAATLEFGDSMKIAGCLSCTIAPPITMLYPLLRGVSRVIIAFDGDEAGRAGAKMLRNHIRSKASKIDIAIRDVPDGEDLKSLYMKKLNAKVQTPDQKP